MWKFIPIAWHSVPLPFRLILNPISSGTQWGQQIGFKWSVILLNCLQNVACMCAVSWGEKVYFLHQVFKRIHDPKEDKEPMIKNSQNIDYYSHFIVREN